jgi:hypothetical protein
MVVEGLRGRRAAGGEWGENRLASRTFLCWTLLQRGTEFMPRAKEPIGPRRPEPPWISAVMLGLTINTLAVGVIAVSAGLAISAAIARGQ